MSHTSANHQQANTLYCQGKSVRDIATALGLSRTAIYGYKNKDLKQGVDWDNLRFIKATDNADAQRNEQNFVALLIDNFEAALDKINTLEPDQQLKELTQYANTYYKLKMQRDNPKINKADLAKLVLHQISQLALEPSADDVQGSTNAASAGRADAASVIRFLADNADAIVTAVID